MYNNEINGIYKLKCHLITSLVNKLSLYAKTYKINLFT